MYNNLKAFGKDKRWLFRKIKEQGYNKIDDIFLMVCNKENIKIYEKNYEINSSVLE